MITITTYEGHGLTDQISVRVEDFEDRDAAAILDEVDNAMRPVKGAERTVRSGNYWTIWGFPGGVLKRHGISSAVKRCTKAVQDMGYGKALAPVVHMPRERR